MFCRLWVNKSCSHLFSVFAISGSPTDSGDSDWTTCFQDSHAFISDEDWTGGWGGWEKRMHHIWCMESIECGFPPVLLRLMLAYRFWHNKCDIYSILHEGVMYIDVLESNAAVFSYILEMLFPMVLLKPEGQEFIFMLWLWNYQPCAPTNRPNSLLHSFTVFCVLCWDVWAEGRL